MEENEDVTILQKKADYFYKTKLPIHVKYKNDIWRNGLIKELSSDFFIIDERELGEMVVFFLELRDIVEFRREGDGEK